MYNRIILIGRLVADPEQRTFQSGDANTRFTLAVSRPFTNGRRARETDFIPIVAWGPVAKVTAQHFRKGQPVAVEGRLQIREYTAKDGARVHTAEVVLDRFAFLPEGTPADSTAQMPVAVGKTKGG